MEYPAMAAATPLPRPTVRASSSVVRIAALTWNGSAPLAWFAAADGTAAGEAGKAEGEDGPAGMVGRVDVDALRTDGDMPSISAMFR
jgi:hypothetical protein